MLDIQAILAANLKRFRAEFGYTQDELAKRARLPDSSIKSYEACRQWPGLKAIGAMARALERKPYELFQAHLTSSVLDHIPAPKRRKSNS